MSGTQPLFGKRVLVTRPVTQAQAFCRELTARGAEPILAPTIRIDPPDDPTAAERALDALASFDWVVFTARSGVDAFFERLTARGIDPHRLDGARVAAIGAATAARLTERGVRADLVPTEFVGEAVAHSIVAAGRAPGVAEQPKAAPTRVLIFRAAQARDVLPKMLAEAGFDVTIAAAYKTVTAFDLKESFASKVARCDVVTFTSASTVRGFCELLGGDAAAARATAEKTVACIGPIAAQQARERGLRVDVTASTHTAAGLLDALEALFAGSS